MSSNIPAHQTSPHEQQNGALGQYKSFEGRFFNIAYYLLNKYHKKTVEFTVDHFFPTHQMVDLNQFVAKLKKAGYGPVSLYRHDTTYNRKDSHYSIDWYLFMLGERVILNIDESAVQDLSQVRLRPDTLIATEDITPETLRAIFDVAEQCLVETEDDQVRYINIVSTMSHGDGLRLTKHKLRSPHIPDLDLYYGPGFAGKHQRFLQAFGEDSQSGLFIFHGVTGSGKTNYIRYLISQCKPDLNFIFYPVTLLREITSPQLITFIADYQNAVLIIEESEETVQARDSFSSDKFSIANLLNVSDGLLSDVLNLKIICTFNTDIKNLDSALLREGRLLGIHKFEKLTAENANRIAAVNKLERSFAAPATLAQIFNPPLKEDLSDFSEGFGSKRIGFQK